MPDLVWLCHSLAWQHYLEIKRWSQPLQDACICVIVPVHPIFFFLCFYVIASV